MTFKPWTAARVLPCARRRRGDGRRAVAPTGSQRIPTGASSSPSDPKECYIVSPPKTSVAKRDGKPDRGAARRHPPLRLLPPGENVTNEVSFTGGYPFQRRQHRQLTVGSDKFTLGPGSRRRRRMGLDRPLRRQPGGGGAAQGRHAPSSPAPRRAAPAPRTPSRSRASPPRSRTPPRAAARAGLAFRRKSLSRRSRAPLPARDALSRTGR